MFQQRLSTQPTSRAASPLSTVWRFLEIGLALDGDFNGGFEGVRLPTFTYLGTLEGSASLCVLVGALNSIWAIDIAGIRGGVTDDALRLSEERALHQRPEIMAHSAR